MTMLFLYLIFFILKITSQQRISEIFSDKDVQCLSNGTIYYSVTQKCYNLLEKGPCQNREWLILKENNKKVESKCETCRCCSESSKKVFWIQDGQCHRTSDKLCPKGMKLINDFDGTGVCICKDGFARVINSEECFPLFERSTVCSQGMYLRLTQGSNTGECVRNPCQQDRLAPWTEGDRYTQDKNHCYEINTQGPCRDADQIFKVLPSDANIVGCFSPAFSITQVPTLCTTGSSGQCRPPISFSGGSNTPVLSSKLQAFLKRKRILVDEPPQDSPPDPTRPSNRPTRPPRPTSAVITSSPTVNYGPSSGMWAWE